MIVYTVGWPQGDAHLINDLSLLPETVEELYRECPDRHAIVVYRREISEEELAAMIGGMDEEQDDA